MKPDLHALALELRRAVSRRWLDARLAEAVILLVALRGRADACAAVTEAEAAQAVLRQPVPA